jgi:predicted lipoprotein with Yx(FWY)xxD motif
VRRLLVVAAASAAIVLVAAGCGKSSSSKSASASPPATSPPTTAAPATTAAAGGMTVAVNSSKLGRILVDAKGRTLYLFEKDKGTTSSCYGACAGGWPPYTTPAAPQAGGGATASLLGTTSRTDGTTQVTYKNHPLYYFVGDTKPGEVTGEGVNAFGAKWYVLAPSGNKIDKD